MRLHDTSSHCKQSLLTATRQPNVRVLECATILNSASSYWWNNVCRITASMTKLAGCSLVFVAFKPPKY